LARGRRRRRERARTRVEHFCRELLDPLAEQDAARGSELLPTLAAFLSSGGRWARTAEELHVHVNTLRHRLERVEALTGRSLDEPDDRVDFHLALRARRLASPDAAASRTVSHAQQNRRPPTGRSLR
jgi:DNA-binding PucR family transcriptional regulator